MVLLLHILAHLVHTQGRTLVRARTGVTSGTYFRTWGVGPAHARVARGNPDHVRSYLRLEGTGIRHLAHNPRTQ